MAARRGTHHFPRSYHSSALRSLILPLSSSSCPRHTVYNLTLTRGLSERLVGIQRRRNSSLGSNISRIANTVYPQRQDMRVAGLDNGASNGARTVAESILM
jgi:hypothetical protein